MGKLSGIELKRARLVPSAVFASPADVVRAGGLSRTQKIAILRRWEFDARPPREQLGARPRRADPEPSSTGSGQAGGCYPGRKAGKLAAPLTIAAPGALTIM